MRTVLVAAAGLLLVPALTAAPAAAADATITGTVTDAATGRPVAGAQVQADGSGPADGSAWDRTDERGRFSLTTSGSSASHVVRVYFLRTAEHPNGDPGPYVPTPNLLPAVRQVSVTSGSTVTADFALQAGGIAEGTLRTPAGRPFP